MQKIIKEKWFTADGVIGFWPAESNNADTVILQTDNGEVKLEFLRQQLKKAIGQPSFSLSDFICPKELGSDFWVLLRSLFMAQKKMLKNLQRNMMNIIR